MSVLTAMELRKQRLAERAAIADISSNGTGSVISPKIIRKFEPTNVKNIDFTNQKTSSKILQIQSDPSNLLKRLFEIDNFEAGKVAEDDTNESDEGAIKEDTGPTLRKIALDEITCDIALRIGVCIEASFDLQPIVDACSSSEIMRSKRV
jgi:hypothetical protein